MTSWQANKIEMKGRSNLATAEFKTMLTLDMSVSNLEEEIDERRCRMSKREFSSRTLEAGPSLSDQEKIIVMTSVVPSGKQVSSQPRTTAAVEEGVVFDATTTTANTTTANSQEQTPEVGV